MLDACLLPLYLSQSVSPAPLLQLLDFQSSEGDARDIMMRVSDGLVFVDCLLVGNYVIERDCITTAGRGRGEEFRKMDLLQLLDYFHKIDESKICKLKIIVRKIGGVQGGQVRKKIGRPQEIAMYACINNMEPKANIQNENRSNAINSTAPSIHFDPLSYLSSAGQHQSQSPNQNQFKSQSQNQNYSQSQPQHQNQPSSFHQSQVKIYESGQVSYLPRPSLEQILQLQPSINVKPAPAPIKHDPDEPLTVKHIMQGAEGFFIGRLLRMKAVVKPGKDGDNSSSIPMLCLGFLDLEGEMLHLNLLGKSAVKEERSLKVDRCYYIKGIILVQVKASNGSYIRLKQPDYRLHEITNEEITKKFPLEYYHWEHENEHVQHESIDVIGIIEDIEEKTFYGKGNGPSKWGKGGNQNQNISENQGEEQKKEKKEVIRVVVRNKFKTVRISFWADQIRFLEALGLKLKEAIIVLDVKKKKSIFLDYSFESSIIKLEKAPDLLSRFGHLITADDTINQPINIQELHEIYQQSLGNNQIFHFKAYLIRIHQNDRFLIKLCQLCKKKINLNSVKCFQCGGNVLSFKYSTLISFADYSASVMVYLFQPLAEKFFGMTANSMRSLQQSDLIGFDSLLQSLLYKQFSLAVQIKGDRIVLRSAQQIDQKSLDQWIKSNIEQFSKSINECKLQEREQIIEQ